MDRKEISSATRSLNQASRALFCFFQGTLNATDGERKALAAIFRKSESEKSRQSLGSLATLANNVKQALPTLEAEGLTEINAAHGGDGHHAVTVRSKSSADVMKAGRGCDIRGTAAQARKACEKYLEAYKALKDAESVEVNEPLGVAIAH